MPSVAARTGRSRGGKGRKPLVFVVPRSRRWGANLIRQLATCRWVAEHQNILITGPTGVGKTFLACALGQQACRQRQRVIYRRIPRLFPELTLAHGDGTYPTVLARFARVDVLILDDWGLVGLKDAQRQDLLEILDDRDGARSTIITSQLPSDRWHEHLGDPTVADAILDRVVHRAHRLTLSGPSRRKPNGNGPSAPKADA
jgi:DNA replication protein DnaC